MYKTKRRLVILATDAILLVVFIFLAVSIVPKFNENRSYSPLFSWISATTLFFAILLITRKLRGYFDGELYKSALFTGETSFLTEFLEQLRYCYSLDDFYDNISEVLEKKADCSVLFIDRKKNYVLYNSPNRLTCDKDVLNTLGMNFPESWKNGVYFIGDNYGIVSSIKKSRGFFMVNEGQHLYIFCRYTKLFDSTIYNNLYSEFCRFENRTKTISDLAEISSLSQEWQQLAETQRSFLPAVMPEIEHLELAAYFRPLVNVSGDYYSVLPISRTKTLLMLGDVSGKGLAAALVMGLVMNTVKILENKSDLPAMIKAVDKAIKSMRLQDKYTVLFLGIVDTSAMTISYVNASMSDPIVITRTPSGYKIKPLTSNCSVVGIIDIPDVQVATQKLYRGDVILMASDGVSEVMDDSGTELGDTELYKNTLCSSAKKHPKEFVDDIVDLVLSYNGGKKLRDDVTMMVAKVVD